MASHNNPSPDAVDRWRDSVLGRELWLAIGLEALFADDVRIAGPLWTTREEWVRAIEEIALVRLLAAQRLDGGAGHG